MVKNSIFFFKARLKFPLFFITIGIRSNILLIEPFLIEPPPVFDTF